MIERILIQLSVALIPTRREEEKSMAGLQLFEPTFNTFVSNLLAIQMTTGESREHRIKGVHKWLRYREEAILAEKPEPTDTLSVFRRYTEETLFKAMFKFLDELALDTCTSLPSPQSSPCCDDDSDNGDHDSQACDDVNYDSDKEEEVSQPTDPVYSYSGEGDEEDDDKEDKGESDLLSRHLVAASDFSPSATHQPI